MQQVYAVFRNTVLESVRQPLYALVLVLACVMIAVTPAMAAHIYTFGAGSGLEHAAERMIADLGLATMLLAGLLLAVFISSGVISREIDDRTALTVLTKRVSRTAFVFGKYLGVAASIGMAVAVCTCALLLTVRMGAAVAVGDPMDWGAMAGMVLALLVGVGVATFRNYYRGRPWVGSFVLAYAAAMGAVFLLLSLVDKDYALIFGSSRSPGESLEMLAGVYDWQVARAALLTVEAVLVMAGVAVAASTRLGTAGNFAVCTVVFLGGLTSEYFAGKYEHDTVAAQVWYAAVPNLQTFWMSDALTRERPIPTVYLGHASLYALCYVLAMLFLAAFLFQKREVT